MEIKMNKYYVAYEDKGPSGPCGQAVSTTAPWRNLYIFSDEQKARDFVTMITDSPFKLGRLWPKILGFWSNDINYNNAIERN